MDMARSNSKTVTPSKATSLRVNSKATGYLNQQLIPTRDNSVTESITDRANTHGVQVAIMREDMRTERRVDMEFM